MPPTNSLGETETPDQITPDTDNGGDLPDPDQYATPIVDNDIDDPDLDDDEVPDDEQPKEDA